MDGPAEAEGPGVVRRQPADPGLRRADQPQPSTGRPAVPEPDAGQPPRRAWSCGSRSCPTRTSGRRRERRASEVFGLGDFDVGAAARPRTSRRWRARSRSRPSGAGEPPTTWSARSAWPWPGWVPRTRRSPRPRACRTAQAADALVAGLDGKDATAALKHLAQARLDTSAAAMSTSLGKAAGVLAALARPSQWETFDVGGPDPRRATSDEAEDLLKDLKDGDDLGRVRRGPGAAPRLSR